MAQAPPPHVLRTAGGAARAGGEPLRGGWLLLGLLCALTAATWAVHYHPFVLPNNDYYSFERVAQALGRGELPAQFKRLPAFPALVAAATPLLPASAGRAASGGSAGPRAPDASDERTLDAALAVNALLALATLPLLYGYARRAFGRGALLVPVLFAATVQFHAMGLQPLVEPTLAFFVVLTFLLYQRRSLWQYATGWVVGLGRVEAALLVPVLAILNWIEEKRFWPHFLLGAAAWSGLLAWTALGALQGRGQSFYLELMEGMGWQPAPGYFLRVPTEAFGFLNVGHPALRAAMLALALVPTAYGAVAGLRRFRRDAVSLLLYLGVTTTVIAGFGVDKARYAYAYQWIPLVFCAFGLLRLRDAAAAWLAPRLAGWRAPAFRSLAVLGLLGSAAVWAAYLHTRPPLPQRPDWPLSAVAAPADGLYALSLVGLAAWALWPRRGTGGGAEGTERPAPEGPGTAADAPPGPAADAPGRAARSGSAVLALAFAAVCVLSGLAHTRTELHDVYYTNYGNYRVARWLAEHLGPDGRAIVLGKKHIQHLTGLDKHRLLSFSKVPVEDVAGLAAFMRENGWTHVVWTHRGEVRNPADAFYYENLKVYIAEAFRSGGPVPGFEHVGTLRVPEEADGSDVQIYRVLPAP